MSQVVDRTGGEAVIEFARQSAISAKDRFLRTFAHIPDEKLNWAPSETSKSALRIAAHVGLSARLFQLTLRRGPYPTNDAAEIFARLSQDELTITSRRQAIDLIETTCAELVEAIAGVDPKTIHESPESPFGPVPMTFWLSLPQIHYHNHAGQLDYLQTAWGDLDPHMG
jgi:hypothetical protein